MNRGKIENIYKKNNKHKSFLKNAVEIKDIKNFEEANNLTLPNDFKEWLTWNDGGDLLGPGGVQLYGILNKPIINVNDNDRPSDDYVVIGRLCNGDPILFKKGEERIFIFDHEANCIHEDEKYSSFSSFLEDLQNILGITNNYEQ